MTDGERLIMLKHNLQMMTDANDTYLLHLLAAGENAAQVEGLRDDGSIDYDNIVIDYAAYLFRSRAADPSGGKTGSTAMPRFLRWQINNLLFKQKIQAGLNR